MENEDDEMNCARVVDCVEFLSGKIFYFFDILDAGPMSPLAVGLIRGLIGSAGGLFESPVELLARLRRELRAFPAPKMRVRALGIRLSAGSSMVEVVSSGWSHLYRHVPGSDRVLEPIEALEGVVHPLNDVEGAEPLRFPLELVSAGALLVCSPGKLEFNFAAWNEEMEIRNDVSALIALVKWREEIVAGRARSWPFPTPPLAWIRRT
jgi:hypothetical protein